METLITRGQSVEYDHETNLGDLPIMSASKSSPIVTKTISIDNGVQNISNNIYNFPMNLVLNTSKNTKIRLQLTEIIEQTVSLNVPNSNNDYNESKDTPSSTPTSPSSPSPSSRINKAYCVGDLVIVHKNKQGLIRYIGQLYNDTNIWYGIELIGGNKGYHDGSFQGQRYFTVKCCYILYTKIVNIFYCAIDVINK